MPLDLSAHIPKESSLSRSLTVSLDAFEDDVTVELSYDPAQYNAEIEALMQEGFDQRPAQVCREIITTFVTEWDLTKDGEPIPITREGLKNVHLFYVQVPIVDAMMQDMTELGKSPQAGLPQSSRGAKQQRRK